jgi:hypothetical protein
MALPAERAARWLALVLALPLSLVPGAALTADAAFITDKLAVGLYATRAAVAEPDRILTSGTPLEILERAGDWCQVRTGTGDAGWLECRYASDETPARTLLVEAQVLNAQLQDELAGFRERLERERQRVAVLERRLRAAETLFPDALAEDRPAPAASSPSPPAVPDPAPDPAPAPGVWPCWPWALPGALGLLAWVVVLFWRCRWRHRGLRL